MQIKGINVILEGELIFNSDVYAFLSPLSSLILLDRDYNLFNAET